MSEGRGSDRLLAAWKARSISEDGVKEIAQALDASPATVRSAEFSGGDSPTGLTVSLSYTGDDAPRCGNDIAFWLKWHNRFGGSPLPPHIIINGIPWPEEVLVELNFGQGTESPAPHLGAANQPGELG